MNKQYDTSYVDICDTYNNDTTTEGNNIPDSRIEKRLNRKQRRDKMKKISIIEELPCEKDVCKKDDCAKCYTEHSTFEQVPESWKEVLELCKKLNNKKIEIIFVDIGIIVHLEDNCEISFTEAMGAMWFKKNDFETRIRTDLTPQQVWNIIKSLVEEK